MHRRLDRSGAAIVCTGILHTMAASDPRHDTSRTRGPARTAASSAPSASTASVDPTHGADTDAAPLTPDALAALAHPVRSRLVAHLRESGPATATELAATLDTNSGATSYHLRRLESVGLVRDTGEGKGRRRVWSAPARSLWWQQDDLDDDSESALAWLGRDLVRHFAEQYDHWLEQSGGWPEPWQDACGVDDASVLVTPESLQQMRSELREVVQRYRRVGQGNPRARRVAVYDFAYPVDLDRPPVDATT